MLELHYPMIQFLIIAYTPGWPHNGGSSVCIVPIFSYILGWSQILKLSEPHMTGFNFKNNVSSFFMLLCLFANRAKQVFKDTLIHLPPYSSSEIECGAVSLVLDKFVNG